MHVFILNIYHHFYLLPSKIHIARLNCMVITNALSTPQTRPNSTLVWAHPANKSSSRTPMDVSKVI